MDYTVPLTCVRDHSYACVYIYVYIYIYKCTRGVGHTDSESAQRFLTRKSSHKFIFVCVPDERRGSNLRSFDLDSDALPTEPPRHPCWPLPKWSFRPSHRIQWTGNSWQKLTRKLSTLSLSPLPTPKKKEKEEEEERRSLESKESHPLSALI